jgi:DinB superfamily
MSAGDPAVAPGWAAYRAELLGLVGGDDPADVQASTPDAVRERIAEASAAGVLRTAPADGEWSVLGLLGHLLDGEIYASARYRWILSEERPALEGYDQDRVANVSRHAEADPEVLFAAWEALRRANLALWAGASADERAREGVHRERGPSSFEILFVEVAGHDRFHLAQMDRTLRTVLPA